MEGCTLCPRACGADRTQAAGACGADNHLQVARAAPHLWEEPCISGTRGSGAVFFSNCALRCCFCQNHPLSAQGLGTRITVERLVDIFFELAEQGVHNINLVSAAHYLPQVVRALELAKPRLRIPVVYNSSGYERVESLRRLEGLVNIYLPDMKFVEAARAGRYADAPDYFDYAAPAILEMYRQTGPIRLDGAGMLSSGVVIRHLVLPKGVGDSKRVLGWIARQFRPGEVLVSLMSQYTPCHRAAAYPEINRRLSTYEYGQLLAEAERLDLQGFMQERSSADAGYTPLFDGTGVLCADAGIKSV